MRTAIVFSAIIIASALSPEATADKVMITGGIAFAVLIFMFLAMDVLDFGKNRP